MSVADLEVEAARFASVLSDVRNGSVCRDVELETVIIAPDRSRDRDRIAVGHRLSEHATPSPIPLSVAESAAEREGAPTWLTLDYKLMLDEHLHHLSVHSSSVGLCIWPNTGRTVIRSEFDRDKDRYPTAHTHVAGTSLELGYAWGALARKPPRGLDDLHFPVRGLRFRPSLEVFIEFLIREGLVAAVHPGWQEHLDASRAAYERIQLQAAVRHDPDAAYEALRRIGFLPEE
jgi:hypothetical protein